MTTGKKEIKCLLFDWIPAFAGMTKEERKL